LRYLLDANVIILALGGTGHGLRERLASTQVEELVTSTIVLAELEHGTQRGLPPTPTQLATFFERVRILPFDEAAARAYARLPFKRARFDRLVAAHALSLGLVVVTSNVADFADIPGLAVENWTR
jgi:tRNA(fMet)-specific endonuclease VapC